MADLELYTPLSSYLPQEYWPVDLFAPLDLAFLDGIAFEGGHIFSEDGVVDAHVSLRVMTEVAFDLPLGLSIVLGNGPVVATVIGDPEGYDIEVHTEIVRLRLPRSLFKPVMEADGKPVADPDETHFAEISLPLGITIDKEWNIDIQWPGEEPGQLNLPPCMIGDTGVIVYAEDIVIRLSSNQALPPGAEEIGLDSGWKGVYIGKATIELPEGLGEAVPSDIQFSIAYIGEGGFSGEIEASWEPAFSGSIFDAEFGLERFRLRFVQNSIEAFELDGTLKLAFFEEPVDVKVAVDTGGKFAIGLRSDNGLVKLTKEDLLEVEIDSLGFELDDGKFTARLSGELTPLIGDLGWPSFQVKELEIDSEGDVRLEGGWLDLPKQYGIDFHGFNFDITKIGFGKNDLGGKFIGFSGGLRFVDGFSAGASVEGLRITWFENGGFDLSLDGVGVEFEVPDVLRFKGEVSYRKLPGDVHRFDGEIKLELLSLDMTLDAQLVIGTQPASGGKVHAFFAIYLGVELPAGIPLGSTNLAIYGISGLFALGMEPGKLPEEPWFEGTSGGWYMRPSEGVADLGKWDPRAGSFALGAGVTIGTLSDNGYAFSGKFLLAIVFPGPIILIEGRANILKKRTELSESAMFKALAVLDGREGTFLFNIAAQYKYGGDGELIDIVGSAEGFFDFSDANAWHVYIGEKEPKEKRIRAEIFRLFEANSYFMLASRSLELGTWIGLKKNWKFGPLRVTAEGWIEGNAALSRKPIYFHGDLWLHGKAGLSVYGYGVDLTIDALFAADVFDPFQIRASFGVGIGLPWPLPDFSVTIRLRWGPIPGVPPLPLPIKEFAIEHLKTSATWPLAAGQTLLPKWDVDGNDFVRPGAVSAGTIAALRTAPPPSGVPVVPLDAKPTITFGRSIHDRPLIGTNANPISPAKEQIGDPSKNEGPLQAEYALRSVELHKFVEGSWILVGSRSDTAPPVGELFGSWAPLANDSGTGVAQSKLMIGSKNAFDYTRHAGAAWNEWITEHLDQYPCIPPPPDRTVCCNFDPLVPGVNVASGYRCPEHPQIMIEWRYPHLLEPAILEPPVHGFGKAICIPPLADDRDGPPEPNQLKITWTEPAKEVRILLMPANRTDGVTVATAFSGSAQVWGPAEPTGRSLEITADQITRVELSGAACVLQICVNLGPDPNDVLLNQSMMQHLIDEASRWSQTGYVLEPYSDYRLTVETEISTSGISSGTTAVTQFGYFRTEGPPGRTRLSVPQGQDAEKFASGLNGLAGYVRQTIPATVPVDGQLPYLPRPVYRAYDVGVEFNENYVDLMYRTAKSDLGLYLYDANSKPARDRDGRLLAFVNRWGRVETLTLSQSDDLWVTTVNGGTCAAIEVTQIPHSTALSASGEKPFTLDADTVYEARLLPLLLHEIFDYGVGTSASGTESAIGRWRVHDEGTNSGPSRWQIGEEGSPPSPFIVQTSNIWGGGPGDALNPGTLLVFQDDPTGFSGTQPSGWGDYRFSFYLRSSDEDILGAVFRYAGPLRHYRLSMDRKNRKLRLVRLFDGSSEILDEAEIGFTLDRDHRITIEAVGPSIRIYRDSELRLAAEDPVFTQGTIGLYACANPAARFHDIRVDDLSGSTPPVFSFKFTTSWFTNFYHHIHSFSDETWGTLIADDVAVAGALARLVQPHGPILDAESKAFEILALLAGVGSAGSTKELTALRLDLENPAGQTSPIGFVVNSPEPIDWRRTSLSLSSTQERDPFRSRPRELKLTEADFGSMRANEERVSFLVRESRDLSGCRVQFGSFPSPATRIAADEPTLVERFETPAGRFFSETFGSNALDAYSIVDAGGFLSPSAWSVSGGRIIQSSRIFGGDIGPKAPEKPGTTALLKASDDWGDVRVNVLMTTTVSGTIGLVFGYRDADNFYRISFDSQQGGYRRLIQKVAGKTTVLWEDKRSFDAGRPYRLTVCLFNDRFSGFLDDVCLFSMTRADARTGRIGLYCWANDGAQFAALDSEALFTDPVLFSADFAKPVGIQVADEPGNAESPSDWVARGDTLTQQASREVEGENRTLSTRARLGDPAWSDIRISVLAGSHEAQQIGVIFRFKDEENNYRFTMDAAGPRRLTRRHEGAETILWEDAAGYQLGAESELVIAASGSSLNVSIGGTTVCQISDDAIRDGNIAFLCGGRKGAWFSKATVTDLTRVLKDWKVVDDPASTGNSEWRIYDGKLWQLSSIGDDTNPSYPATYSLLDTEVFRDCRVRTRLNADGGGSAGVIFRYRDADNYYRLTFDRAHNRRRLVKKAAGLFTILWEDQGSYSPGAPFEIVADLTGARIVVHLDSALLLDVTDASHQEGKIGVYFWREPGASVEHLEVSDPPAACYELFRDRFDQGDFSAWSILDQGTIAGGSNWEIRDGVLHQSSNIHEPPNDRDSPWKLGTMALAGDETWTDVLVRVRLRAFDDDAVGVVFRYTDENNYYRFSMDSERSYRRLVSVTNGVISDLWEDDYQFESGRPYELQFLLREDRIEGYVDGVPMLAIRNEDHRAGKIGLYCWGNIGAEYSQVSVTPAELANDSWLIAEDFRYLDTDRWQFVDDGTVDAPSFWSLEDGGLLQSSNIGDGTNLPAQIEKRGTFALAGDPGWTDYRISVSTASADRDAIGVMFRYRDPSNYYRFSMDSRLGYRRLVKNTNGVATVLWQDQVAYEAGRSYSLTFDCLGSRIRGYVDGIEEFSLEDKDHPSGRIGLYCHANQDAFFSLVRIGLFCWQDFFQFGDVELSADGSKFAISSGNLRFDIPPGTDEGDWTSLYAAVLSDPGYCRLSQSECEIRLVGPNGNTIHGRRFAGPSSYESVSEIKVLRRSDGTAFFFTYPDFSTSGYAAEGASYRLRLSYRRDNRSVESESLVLHQAGDTSDEIAVIEIPFDTLD